MTSTGGTTPYDEVRYPTYSHSQLHPDRLAVPAVLQGLRPAPAEACRYLELGCGDGGTLLALAQALPGSTFVGVDLAPTSVQRGRERAAAAGLGNVELLTGDLADLPADLGTFDHITCHGVFSWVPPAARDGILRTFQRHLAPEGVAYVSYNANPSGLLREMSRQMVRFHLRAGGRTPEELLREGQQLLGFLASCRPEGDPWRTILEGELGHLQQRLPESFVHDELAEINTPFWLFEVVAMAEAFGLRLLGEADDLGGGSHLWPDPARELLDALEDEPEAREQYLDMLLARRFHQTLLCHGDAVLDRPPPVSRMRELSVAGQLAADPGVDLTAEGEVDFTSPSGLTIGTGTPLMKAALALLGAAWPQAVPFDDLLAQARADSGRSHRDDAAALGRFLLRAQGARLVELRRHRPPWPLVLADVGPTPLGSPLARRHLEEGAGTVPTLRADMLALDELPAVLLGLCDGHRDRAALAEALVAARPHAVAAEGAHPALLVDAGLALLAAHALLLA